ncbi:MarR family transcriptional regulator [Humibacter sp. BT305]|nr:MarR family transcriptional regulator [Humibacter sp. BT305]
MLSRLDEHGPATAAELAVAEQITAQAVAVALRELEDRGFISRASDPDDRRRVRVSLTDSGRGRLREERARGTRWLDGAIRDRLDDADRAALQAVVPVLRKLSGEGVDE